MSQPEKPPVLKSGVQHLTITRDDEGQRIDNFLVNRLKGMPKSRIYRIIRKGEVRVNKKRIDASYRLIAGDELRLPPVFLPEKAQHAPLVKLLPTSFLSASYLKMTIY